MDTAPVRKLPVEPWAHGLKHYAHELRCGNVSAEAAAAGCLERIAILNPLLNAYIHVAPELALQQAREVDAKLAMGIDLGPLMGVPVAVKDNFAVAGMPTGGGSRVPVADMAGKEGMFIRRLRDAGCIILGKAHTVEFALGSAGTNYTMGSPRNPRDMHQPRVTGGSSSGSAAAVAGGLCGFAIGSDTGGSVRTPAAFCGVLGMKPARGAWARDGMIPLSVTLDAIGYLARDAEDAGYVWQALADEPVPATPLHEMRIGVPRQFMIGLHQSIERAIDEACQRLAAAGASIKQVDLPDFDAWNEHYFDVCGPEFLACLGSERYAASADFLNPDVRQRLSESISTPAVAYMQSKKKIEQLRAHAHQYFSDVDIWLGPTKQYLAPLLPAAYEAKSHAHMVAQCAGPTRTANVLDLCALSMPIACDPGVLPAGLQLAAPAGHESRLLSISREIEALLGKIPLPIIN